MAETVTTLERAIEVLNNAAFMGLTWTRGGGDGTGVVGHGRFGSSSLNRFGALAIANRLPPDAEPRGEDSIAPSPTPDELGRIAYEVMQAAIKPHLASHRYTPAWDRLDEMLQAGWIAAAEAVAAKVMQGAEKPAVGPAPTWGDSLPEYRGRDRRYYFREYTDVSGSRTVSVHPQFPRECQIGPHPRNRYCLIPLPVEPGGKAVEG